MYRLNIWIVVILSSIMNVSCQEEKKETKILISTSLGDMTAILYENTPNHRDNFLKLIEEDFFDGLLFHRVIPDFMIQGGDPDSKNAEPGQMLGLGDLGYTIPAEFGELHKKGALSAARTGDPINPTKASNASQFFIVQGRPVEEDVLDYFEQKHQRVYTQEERKLYTESGGRPDLDMEYTVFGELIDGFDVLEKIIAMPRDARDRPHQDIKMNIKIIED